MSLFQGQIEWVDKYGPGEPGKEGSIKKADFVVAGHRLACIDSPIPHGFTFTPAVSLFVECVDLPEFERAFTTLSDGGAVLMPPDNYGFSSRFAWLNDRFGVSWQLNVQ